MRANTKYIKQCVAMSLILSSVLLSGCASKIDEVSQKMMDDINAIGTVEISDEEAIEKAEKLYATLTDKQKEQVNNYADLLNARDELDKLLEEKAKKDAEEAEKAKVKYKETYSDTFDMITLGCLNSEEFGGLTERVWYNCIYEKSDPETDKYTKGIFDTFYSDFNYALSTLFKDSDYQSGISAIRDSQDESGELIKELNNPPEGWEEAYKDIQAFYDSFISLSNLVISPSGNLQSYSDNFSNADNEMAKNYKKVKAYLE